jgi:hypothetical protein
MPAQFTGYLSEPLQKFPANVTDRFAIFRIAATLRLTSRFVVAHEDTLMRIALRPFQTVPPHQQVPSACTASMTLVLISSPPKQTST